MRPVLYLVMTITFAALLWHRETVSEPTAKANASEAMQMPIEKRAVPMTALLVKDGYLYTGDTDGHIRVLDSSKGNVLYDWYAHIGIIRGFLADESGLYSIGASGSIGHWGFQGEPRRRHRLIGHHLNGAAVLSDGGFVVVGDRGIVARLGDGPRWRANGIHGRAGFGVATSPDGSQVATAGADGHVRIWTVDGGEETKSWRAHKQWVSDLYWEVDGIWTAGTDGFIRRWDPTGTPIGNPIKTPNNEVQRFMMSPRIFVTAGTENKVAIYDRKTASLLRTISTGNGPLISLTVHKNLLYGGRPTGGISIWDVTNGKEIATLPTIF
jgi:WD40 repeat protein